MTYETSSDNRHRIEYCVSKAQRADRLTRGAHDLDEENIHLENASQYRSRAYYWRKLAQHLATSRYPTDSWVVPDPATPYTYEVWSGVCSCGGRWEGTSSFVCQQAEEHMALHHNRDLSIDAGASTSIEPRSLSERSSSPLPESIEPEEL